MVHPTASPAVAPSESSSESTFVFTPEQERFIFVHVALLRVERDTLTRLFNGYFETSLSGEMIARAVHRIAGERSWYILRY